MRLLALAMMLVATSAGATAPSASSKDAKPVVPLSVWRTGAAGAMEHLQSGLVCPTTLGRYRRDTTQVYDFFGQDVSCGYIDGDTVLTIYMTRRNGTSAEDAMAQAKREMLQVNAARHPQPVSDARSSDAGADFAVALYGWDGGQHTGIWIADVNGWTLEYRLTYAAAGEAAVLQGLKPVTAHVLATAGARLALCAKSPPPQGSGKLITDQKKLSELSTMTSLLGGVGQMAAQEGKAEKTAPLHWCVEQARKEGDIPLLFWRAVDDAGADARAERISAVTVGEPPVLELAVDGLAELVETANGKGGEEPRWTATLQDGDKTWIFGYFDGRPSADTATGLFLDILNHKAKAVGGYSAKDKSITIMSPPSH